MRLTLDKADLYQRVAHNTPGVDMVHVMRVIDELFNIAHVNRSGGELVWVNTTHGTISFGDSPPTLSRKNVSTPKGSARCGWCLEVHKIEQIKVCRWKANRIDPAVFEAARLAALGTASKLKENDG